MRKLMLVAVLVGGLAVPAMASDCVQSDGQAGVVVSGSGSPDDQCLTPDEYQEMFSVPNLVDAGVITVVSDNGDGTVGVVYNVGGGSGTLVSDALDRPVAATPSLEPDAPTVREVLYPASAFRLAALIG